MDRLRWSRVKRAQIATPNRWFRNWTARNGMFHISINQLWRIVFCSMIYEFLWLTRALAHTHTRLQRIERKKEKKTTNANAVYYRFMQINGRDERTRQTLPKWHTRILATRGIFDLWNDNIYARTFSAACRKTQQKTEIICCRSTENFSVDIAHGEAAATTVTNQQVIRSKTKLPSIKYGEKKFKKIK